MPPSTPETAPLPNLDRRRRAAGLTLMGLARLAEVGYPKLWRATADQGANLTAPEIARVEAALRQTKAPR